MSKRRGKKREFQKVALTINGKKDEPIERADYRQILQAMARVAR